MASPARPVGGLGSPPPPHDGGGGAGAGAGAQPPRRSSRLTAAAAAAAAGGGGGGGGPPPPPPPILGRPTAAAVNAAVATLLAACAERCWEYPDLSENVAAIASTHAATNKGRPLPPRTRFEAAAPAMARVGFRPEVRFLARLTRRLWWDERTWRSSVHEVVGLRGRRHFSAAARVGDLGRCGWLASLGADIHARDGWGRSALTEAVAGGHAGVAGWLRASGVEEDVVWEGVDVTAAGDWGPWVAGAGGGGVVAAGAVDPVYALAVVSCDEIAVGHQSGVVIIRDLATGGARATLLEHTDRVYALASLPHGRLASGSSDLTVRVWRVDTGVCERTLIGHTSGVSSLTVLLSGLLASGSYDSTVRLWDTTTGACTATLQLASSVISLAALPCGGVASGCSDGSIALWSAGGVRTGTLGGAAGYGWVWSLALMQDGRLAAGHGVTANDFSIRVWDVARRELDACFVGHTNVVRSLTVLPDGRLLSGSDDHMIRVWGEGALSVRGGGDTAVCAATLVGQTDSVLALVVLRDGAVASGSWDGSARFWN